MLFKEVIKLKNDKITVLDQKKIISKFNHKDIYDYTVDYGGCTIVNDELWVNYSYNETILWYDVNKIKLLLPKEIYDKEYQYIYELLGLMNVDFINISAYGYWLDNEGHQILDDLEIISFYTPSLDKVNFFIKLASRLAEEYKEEVVGLYVNDALLLIKGGLF